MKKEFTLIAFLVALSAGSGYMMSRMSWLGRVGIKLIHKEYTFLKVWWQGGAAVLGGLLVVMILLAIFHKIFPRVLSGLLSLVFLAAGVLGTYVTYNDFQEDWTHKKLNQNFHIGVYMFWAGWAVVCIFYLVKPKRKVVLSLKDTDNKAVAAK
jgi:hypothetical protein